MVSDLGALQLTIQVLRKPTSWPMSTMETTGMAVTTAGMTRSWTLICFLLLNPTYLFYFLFYKWRVFCEKNSNDICFCRNIFRYSLVPKERHIPIESHGSTLGLCIEPKESHGFLGLHSTSLHAVWSIRIMSIFPVLALRVDFTNIQYSPLLDHP